MIRRRLVQLARSAASPICVAPVPNVQLGHNLIGVVDLVNHTVGSNSDSPTFSSSELLAAWRARALCQCTNGVSYFQIGVARKAGELFLSTASDQEAVAHLCSRSISSTACPNEMTSSPAAFALS